MMDVKAFIFILSGLIILRGNAQLQPDETWAQFHCFSEEEASEYRQQIGIDANHLRTHSLLNAIANTWSLQSYVSSILMQDILSMNVQLYDFDETAASLVDAHADDPELSFIVHWGLSEKDHFPFHGDNIWETEARAPCITRWMIRDSVASEIEQEIGTNPSNGLHLSFWRSYTLPEVIGAMDKADDIDIPPNNDGHFPCDLNHECMYGDSTWYPPQCNKTLDAHHDCMVLLQFTPEEDSELNRELIIEKQLPIVIKYLGSPRTSLGQSNFHRFYALRSRVIFQLQSTDTQSHTDYGWTGIALPLEEDININAYPIIWRLRQEKWRSWSYAILHFLDTMNLESEHLASMQSEIISAEGDETDALRMEVACDWLRSESNVPIWTAWFRELVHVRWKADCALFHDEDLEYVDAVTPSELWSNVEALWANTSHIEWSWWALYAKDVCILEYDDGRNDGLFLFGYVLSGFAAVSWAGVVLCTIKWRKKKIIVAASVKMLAVIYFGAAVALSFIFFLRPDRVSHCVGRRYIEQIGIVLMFTALEEKTRRLLKIQESIKLLQSVKITDLDLFRRILGMTGMTVCYLTILMIAFPIEIVEPMTNGMYVPQCVWDKSAQRAYEALLLVEMLAVFSILWMAWSLRTTNV